jgi:hypothetical protein
MTGAVFAATAISATLQPYLRLLPGGAGGG